MRIGYITNHYPRATDTFIQREVAALRKRGLDIRTFSVRRSGSEHDVSPEVIAEKRQTHYLLPVAFARLLYANASAFLRAPHRYLAVFALALETRRPGVRGLALQLAYFQEAVILSLELRRQRITHVHDHGGDNSGTVTLLAGALSRVGYSITIHGPYIFFDPTHWALRQKLRDSRFIACISHYCRSQVMLFSDQSDWDRLKIVRCGIDVERFPYADVRKKVRQLLYVGRLAVEKGLPVLFESLRILLARGYDFELTLAGDGNDRKRLDTSTRSACVSICGRAIYSFYRASPRVCLSASWRRWHVEYRCCRRMSVVLRSSLSLNTPVYSCRRVTVPLSARHSSATLKILSSGKACLGGQGRKWWSASRHTEAPFAVFGLLDLFIT
jgi:colanic acid/amylovoran biosynthesis glycosyltransferase